jgi:uncharacterized protein YndB with AHSA1/START domain
MSATAATHDLSVTRTFDAPVSELWHAWSDAEHVKRWWGPNGFTVPVVKMNFREGGTTLVSMQAPEGYVLYNTWSYTKIVPLQSIEFVLHFSDENGNKMDPTQIGLPQGIPDGVRHLITFSAVGDNKTEMNVTEFGYGNETVVEISKSGLVETLDKLAASFK